MSADVKNAQNAVKGMQKAKDMEGKLGLDDLGSPPLCHIVVNAIAAFFVAPLGHYLARPSDIKSLSFMGVSVVWFVCWVLNMIPVLGDIAVYVTGPVMFVVIVYTCFVAFVSEKRNPRKKAASSGVLSMERGGFQV